MENWKDFVNGLFSRSAPHPPPPPPERNPNVWPPPPPLLEFPDEDPGPSGGAGASDSSQKGDSNVNSGYRSPPRGFNESDEPQFPWAGVFWGSRPPSIPQQQEVEEELGNSQLVFNDMFQALGQMFQEMERSLRDMDRFFGHGHGGPPAIEGIPPGFSPNQSIQPIGPPPPAGNNNPTGSRTNNNDKTNNVRDFVLKESVPQPALEGPTAASSRNRSKHHYHYIPEPGKSADKIDKDLDLLHQKYMLDLSDMPVPSSTSRQESVMSEPRTTVLPYDPQQGRAGGGMQPKLSFQRVYQTYSFKNGRMEGESVKEDESGRHVTRYYHDENGQKHETTEFFPRDGWNPGIEGPPSSSGPPLPPDQISPLFNLSALFDRMFRPRI